MMMHLKDLGHYKEWGKMRVKHDASEVNHTINSALKKGRLIFTPRSNDDPWSSKSAINDTLTAPARLACCDLTSRDESRDTGVSVHHYQAMSD